jgi:hypothetical protein
MLTLCPTVLITGAGFVAGILGLVGTLLLIGFWFCVFAGREEPGF